jgi:integrase
MAALAPILQGYFTDRLAALQASPETVRSYRDTYRLLLTYLLTTTGTPPSRLDLADLNAQVILGFLDHLRADRGNGAATRNLRLTAIHSLFRYAALRCPEHADLIAQRSCDAGSRTARRRQPSRCSQPAAVAGRPRTRSLTCSPNTSHSPPGSARRSRSRTSPRTPCGIPAR